MSEKKELKELNDVDLEKVTGGGSTKSYDTMCLLNELKGSADDNPLKPDEQTLEEIAKDILS